jgi:hypothetical protein
VAKISAQTTSDMSAVQTTKSGLSAAGNTWLWTIDGKSDCGSNAQSAGVFVVEENWGQSFTALLNAAVTEGSNVSPFYGDALFEIISAMWDANGRAANQ